MKNYSFCLALSLFIIGSVTMTSCTPEEVPIDSTYEITVVTSNTPNAGTNAGIFIKFQGSNSSTTDLHLDNQRNNHEQGDVDVYSYELRDIGDIQSAVLYHDNSGEKPGWLCESVTIRKVKTGEEWYFNVNKWFATSTGDGKIRRTIYPN